MQSKTFDSRIYNPVKEADYRIITGYSYYQYEWSTYEYINPQPHRDSPRIDESNYEAIDNLIVELSDKYGFWVCDTVDEQVPICSLRTWFDLICIHAGSAPSNNQYDAQEIISFIEEVFHNNSILTTIGDVLTHDEEHVLCEEEYEEIPVILPGNSMVLVLLAFKDTAILTYSAKVKRMVLMRLTSTTRFPKLTVTTDPTQFDFDGISTIMVSSHGYEEDDRHSYLLVRNPSNVTMSLDELLSSTTVQKLYNPYDRPSENLIHVINAEYLSTDVIWIQENYETMTKEIFDYKIREMMNFWTSVPCVI